MLLTIFIVILVSHIDLIVAKRRLQEGKSLPLCRNNNYFYGRWILINESIINDNNHINININISQKSFFCCENSDVGNKEQCINKNNV